MSTKFTLSLHPRSWVKIRTTRRHSRERPHFNLLSRTTKIGTTGSKTIEKYVYSRRFSLVKEHLIEFTQLAMANSEGSDDMLNRVMPKDNIGLAALLKTKEAAWDNGKSCT